MYGMVLGGAWLLSVYDVILNPANRERFQKALTSGTDFR